MALIDRVYVPLDEWLDVDDWPIASLIPDELDQILVAPGEVGATGDLVVGFALVGDVVLRIPGVDAFALAFGSAGTVEFDVTIKTSPFVVEFSVPLVLRIRADVLRQLEPGTDRPIPGATHFDISLGSVALSIDADGNIEVAFPGTVSLPRCMVGSTGVILQIGSLRWLSPATASPPSGTPLGFTGLYLDDVDVKIPGAPGTLKMDDVFLGTGGFSGKIQQSGLTLTWDGSDFDGDVHGELFGFKGGLTSAQVEFRQSALVGCDLRGDVFVPYLDKRLGLRLGLSGNGGLTASAGLPTSTPPETSVTAGGPGYLAHLDVSGFMELDLDALRFSAPVEGPPLVELSGRIAIDVDGIDCPPITIQALRIDAGGGVAIEGGWLDLADGRRVGFHGFPLEITRLGFGSENSRRWIGLNGGLKLADGLPMGASVEGLRISWDPGAADIPASVGVTLGGIGLSLDVPGAFTFEGAVAFFSEDISPSVTAHGFRGHGHLELPALKTGVDANLVIGRTSNDDTFFYFQLGIELPVGIPLFSTGAAIYGFQGLVATNMSPNRRADEPWYYGWYLREPKGATDAGKWGVNPGAFALGVGATIGTAPDDGFAFSTKTLLILVLPGPQLLLEGKGSFLAPRPTTAAGAEGNFEALLVLDIPSRLFQLNLAATYDIVNLVRLRGGADVGLSWARPIPAHFWHVYLGEWEPPERRWQASLLSIFEASAYFMLESTGIALGAWVGIDEDWRFGPVRVYVSASIEGHGAVSWAPAHFEGSLRISGAAGVSVFGVGIGLSASAGVEARGPTPWYVHFDLQVGIRIDLWLFSFEWSATLEFSWGDASQPLPPPVLPIVLRLAHEHLKVDEGGDLDGATIPPDGRPVVIFTRPVRDLASIGAPGTPTLPPEEVGPRRFSYRLAHLALVRTSGGSPTTIGALGLAEVSGGTVSLPGSLNLPGVNGAQVKIAETVYDVTGGSSGAITLAGTVPGDGIYAYRLHGRRDTASVQVLSAKAIGAGLAAALLAAAPTGTFAGGRLEAGGAAWTVVDTSGATVTVRTGLGGMPTAGAATLVGPQNRLGAIWHPADDVDPQPTKLQLWARTPYAYFRHSESSVTEGFDLANPDYACGPGAVEQPICVDFDDVPLGPLLGAFPAELLQGTASGDVRSVSAKQPDDHLLLIGEHPGGGLGHGVVTFTFTPPVERVWVYGSTMEGGSVVARRRGASVASAGFTSERPSIEIAGEIDELEVSGTLVTLHKICFVPGWTCTSFEALSFPQDSTGRRSYAGVWLETAGRMRVTGNVLVVTPPSRAPSIRMTTRLAREQATLVATSLVPLPLAADALANRFGARGPEPATAESATVALPIQGLTRETAGILPGLGVVLLVPAEFASAARSGLAVRSRSASGGPWLLDDSSLPMFESMGRPSMGGIPMPARTARNRLPIPIGDVPDPSRDLVIPGDELRRQLLEAMLRTHWVVGRFEDIALAPVTQPPPVATIVIYLPEPATRVRVRLDRGATVSVHGGARQVATAVGTAGSELFLRAVTGYIDRIVVVAPGEVRVQRVCTDAGEFGWARLEQWEWRQSVRRSIEAFYDEDPVLPPGGYRLDVVTGWVDEAGSGNPAWTTKSADFVVGPPPGLGSGTGDTYPAGGPLDELATYVRSTLPGPAARPFYRSYDVAVAFNENYVSRMFLSAGQPITVAVVDSNGADRRAGAANVWGRGPELELRREETDWLRTLHGDGTERCAELDLSKVVRAENVSAGAGELLGPEELHAGQLRAGGRTLFSFEFVTSRFTTFVQHVGSFDGVCRRLGMTKAIPDRAPILAVESARAAVHNARVAAAAAIAAAEAGTPSVTQLNARDTAVATLKQNRATLAAAEASAFEALRVLYGLERRPVLPRAVELARLPEALLVESPEPLHWPRLAFDLRRTSALPLQTRTVRMTDAGAPDAGAFRHAGLDWTTSAELRSVSGALEARVTGPLSLAASVPQARRVEVFVRVAAGGNVTLSATGIGTSGPVTQGPTGGSDASLAVTGGPLTAVTLTGTGFALVSLAIAYPFEPGPARGDVRIVAARLPASATDAAHSVDVVALRETSLTGWSARWIDALAPGAPARYHAFQSGRTLGEERIARVFGGAAGGLSALGMDAHFGGTVGTVPLAGAVFQLVDPLGAVVHEFAALDASGYSPASGFIAVPNDDGTRAFLVAPAATTLAEGHWLLSIAFARDIGPDLPRLSVGGDSSLEQAVLAYTIS